MSPRIGPAISPRAAVTTIFALNGAAFGAWAGRIPALENRLDLGEGGLAVVLGAIAAGALAGMPIAGRVLARKGSRAPTRAYLLAFTVVVSVIAAAPSMGTLIALAFLFGAIGGSLDVAMNAQGVAVERQVGRPILSSMHAAWSVGGLLGAGSAALSAAVGLDARVQLLILGVAFLAIGVRVGMALLPATADAPAAPDPAADARPPAPSGARRRLFILGVVAFCSLLAEGAAADWSGVYVHNSLGASEAVAALAFTAYALAMTISRLIADHATTAVGPVALLRGSTMVAAAGMGLALLVDHPAAALLGFACLGFGVAPVIPLVFRAAGAVPGVAAGPALAQTSVTGYFGLLAGPPLIGLLAEATSLPVALGAVVASVALCAAFAGAVAIAPAAAPTPAPAPA